MKELREFEFSIKDLHDMIECISVACSVAEDSRLAALKGRLREAVANLTEGHTIVFSFWKPRKPRP